MGEERETRAEKELRAAMDRVWEELHKETDETDTVRDEMDKSRDETDVVQEKKKEVCCCCSHKTKERSEKEYRDLLNRLSRIEGQVRGIRRMVEEDVYCTDILIQVSAVNAALNSFNKVLLANHIRTCVADDIRNGKDETVDELVTTLQKLMR